MLLLGRRFRRRWLDASSIPAGRSPSIAVVMMAPRTVNRFRLAAARCGAPALLRRECSGTARTSRCVVAHDGRDGDAAVVYERNNKRAKRPRLLFVGFEIHSKHRKAYEYAIRGLGVALGCFRFRWSKRDALVSGFSMKIY